MEGGVSANTWVEGGVSVNTWVEGGVSVNTRLVPDTVGPRLTTVVRCWQIQKDTASANNLVLADTASANNLVLADTASANNLYLKCFCI